MSILIKKVSFVLLLPIILLSFNTETMSVLLSADTESLKNLSQGSFLLLLLFTILLMTVQNLFTIIPLILLISINVTLFGFTGGYIWSWLISIMGSAVSFFLSRYAFQAFFSKYVNSEWKNKIENKGFWFVFTGRIMPFVPTSVVNIAAGISTVRFSKFFYATALGNMIYFFVLSAISVGILSIPWGNGIFALALLILLIILFLRRMKKL
jgi:uncharacterized membrane protein YdjX (TVP38/TMEM64 family)